MNDAERGEAINRVTMEYYEGKISFEKGVERLVALDMDKGDAQEELMISKGWSDVVQRDPMTDQDNTHGG